MGFLSDLGNIVQDQLGTGENTTNSLQTIDGSKVNDYGLLGNYKFDTSAERNYLEDGFVRDIRPRFREILFQQPEITVVVKKRMFSSLADNARLDLLEEKERIILAASKRLFQNKCKIIAAYERLTKIENVVKASGQFNTYMAPMVLQAIDNLLQFTGSSSNFSGSTLSNIDKLRKIISYSDPGFVTNWTTNDFDSVFKDTLGEGPGTFEITTVASVNTTASVEWGGGNASLSIEDPYNLLRITERDIDQALSDAANPFRNLTFAKFTQKELQNNITSLKQQLAIARGVRGVSQISFITSPETILSKRVRAVLDSEGIEIKFNYHTGLQNAFSGIEQAQRDRNLPGKDGLEGFAAAGDLFTGGTVEIDPAFINRDSDPVIIGKISPDKSNKLTESEGKIFANIITSIFTLLDYNTTSQRNLSFQQSKLNYARNRMRMMFNGRFIFQPMDVVNIFMNTKSGEDERLSQDFRNVTVGATDRLAEQFGKLIRGANEALAQMQGGGIGYSVDDFERIGIMGPDFPAWLWKMFRSDITSQNAGTAIFVGLVSKASGSWSDGKWNVSVTCTDNTAYFSKGMVNFKPSADVVQATIYDPLTPFDLSFDAATGTAITSLNDGIFPDLLPENKRLLNTGAVVFNTGGNRGGIASDKKYRSNNGEVAYDKIRNVLHDPTGLVYRWKQGIQTLTFTSRSGQKSSTEDQKAILLTNKPFAGQDVMNVLSILITGQPYNYGNFLKAAIDNGNNLTLKPDKITGRPPAVTYLESLLADIKKNNSIWGDFIPFKKLVMDPSVDRLLGDQRFHAITENNQLKNLLAEYSQIQDRMALRAGPYAQDAKQVLDVTAKSDQARANFLEKQILLAKKEFIATIKDPQAKNPNLGLNVIGNDIATNPQYGGSNNPKENTEQKRARALEMRRKMAQVTLRRLWDVKANSDRNFFIVDDQYDGNLDIQAFERKIGNSIELFNSEFAAPGEQIKATANILGLEIFANTQGHIEVRPPAYNKIPSSVWIKMFHDRDKTGAKVFPQFLETLYMNQLNGLLDKLVEVEDNIRLRAVALGAKGNDVSIIKTLDINNSTTNTFKQASFAFVSKDGVLDDVFSIVKQGSPDLEEGIRSKALETLSEATKQIENKQYQRLFDPTVQTSVVLASPDSIPNDAGTIAEVIRERLRLRTGVEPPTISELFGNKELGRIGAISKIDVINVVNQIANYVSEQQGLVKSLVNTFKNLREGLLLDAPVVRRNIFGGGVGDVGSFFGGEKLIKPTDYNRLPDAISHMIEREDEDDIALGSSKRFVIRGNRILKLDLEENEPPFTMVTVKGLFGEGFLDAPSSLKTSSDGNAVTSAYAVDYDLWHMYGFKASRTVEAPFFRDPDSQCAPYAIATLLQARRNILQGSVGVAGYNEFYQPGDVVYIEDENLLFYVASVSHSFSYGSISTTLKLEYGHSPGEYIPNMLDIVGKILYNTKKFSGQYRSSRFETAGAMRSLGAIVMDAADSPQITAAEELKGGATNTDILTRMFRGSRGEKNKNILSLILLGTSGALNQVGFAQNKAKIRIRYYAPNTGKDIKQAAEALKEWLTTPQDFSDTFGLTAKNKSYGISRKDVIIEEVEFDEDIDQGILLATPTSPEGASYISGNGPSAAAWAMARELETANGSNTVRSDTDTLNAPWRATTKQDPVKNNKLSPDELRNNVSRSILDIFVSYETASAVINSSGDQSSQKGQADSAAVQAIKPITPKRTKTSQ